MVAVWYLIMLGMMAYFVFKVVRMYEPSQMDKYVGSIKFLTFFGKASDRASPDHATHGSS